MTIHSSAGSVIALSAAQPATYDAAGYGALTYTELGEVSDLGDFGRVYNIIKYNIVKTRVTNKRKGAYDEGTMNLKVGLDNSDAGQILAKAAAESDNNYSFKVTIQDGTAYYFQAQVMSFKVTVGTVDAITEVMITLELTSDPNGGGIVQNP